MTDDGSNSGEWAASESKDWKDGRHRRDNRHVHAHAGEVPDRRTRRHLTALTSVFERASQNGKLEIGASDPDTFEETEEYRRIMSYHATEGFGDAIAEGDAAGVRHYVGSQEDTPDISGYRAIQSIEDLVTGDASMLYVYGHMGNGKSMFASLVAEIWKRQMPDSAEVAANSRTIDAATGITSWPALNDWMIESESTILAGEATRKLFIFDEASSQASGRGKDGYDASTKLATMCYKIRKYGGSLIIIGHDGKDVHPAVREMCTAFHKTGKKTGQFYEEVKNRKGRDPITRPLEGIPLPQKRWQPNTYDLADWSWRTAEDDGIEAEDAFEKMAIWTVIQCKQDGLSDRDTAEFVPFGKSKVNRVWNDYEDGTQYQDVADTVTEVFA